MQATLGPLRTLRQYCRPARGERAARHSGDEYESKIGGPRTAAPGLRQRTCGSTRLLKRLSLSALAALATALLLLPTLLLAPLGVLLSTARLVALLPSALGLLATLLTRLLATLFLLAVLGPLATLLTHLLATLLSLLARQSLVLSLLVLLAALSSL